MGMVIRYFRVETPSSSHLSCRITQETFVEGHRCGTRAFPIFAAATSRQSL